MATNGNGTYGSIPSVKSDKSDESTKLVVSSEVSRPSWLERNGRKSMGAAGIAVMAALVALYFVGPMQNVKYLKIPASDSVPHYFDQIVNHNVPTISSNTWSQKYFENTDYFGGPGSPIFVILGGEDVLERILYPYISHVLAKEYNAYTLCPEHRFYGTPESSPVKHPTRAELKELLTMEQAMQDTIGLIRAKQAAFKCGKHGTPEYCPVMTVGGSCKFVSFIRYSLLELDTAQLPN
jgi:hypothetical protein